MDINHKLNRSTSSTGMTGATRILRLSALCTGLAVASLSMQATALGFNAVELGVGAAATSADSIAIGKNSTATGVQGIAIGGASSGTYTTALGNQSIAIGSNVESVGHSSIAIGGDDLNHASNTNLDGTTATGINSGTVNDAFKSYSGGNDLVDISNTYNKNTKSDGTASVAIGVKSTSSGALSSAVGTHSNSSGTASSAFGVASSATLDGSVALGAGSTTATNATTETTMTVGGITYNVAGQAANAGAQVSVGSAGSERQMKHVAAGRVDATSTDAVNGSQLHATNDAVGKNTTAIGINTGNITTNTNNIATNTSNIFNNTSNINTNTNNIKNLGYRIDDVEDDANAGISAAMAMSSLPQAYIPGKSMVAGGIATYNGESAIAIGLSKVTDNGRWVIKGNASADTQSNFGAGVGAGFHF